MLVSKRCMAICRFPFLMEKFFNTITLRDLTYFR